MQLSPLLNASPAIQLHVAAAIGALLLGGAILFRRKGDAGHRFAGRLWAGLMVVVAGSSFFIHELRLWGPWSPIHLLSLLTFASLAWGVRLARRSRITAHRRTMAGIYVGALVITGFFTLLPGRIMHEVIFTGALKPGEAALAGLLFAVLAGAVLALTLAGGRGDVRDATRQG